MFVKANAILFTCKYDNFSRSYDAVIRVYRANLSSQAAPNFHVGPCLTYAVIRVMDDVGTIPLRIAASSSTNAASNSSACTMKPFPYPCASTIQIVRH
jgi:hypothetical protein